MSGNAPDQAKNLIAFLRRLRAVRQFRPDPVPDGVLRDILEVARWSGSANNRQPWELVVVRDGETLKKLGAAEGYAKHVSGAPLAIVIVTAGERERFEHETFDTARLAERMMLAAAAHGLGASIGWFNGRGIEQVKDLLGIPTDRLVRTAISFGYPDEAARSARPKPAQGRKPLAEIVRYERYS